MKKIMFNDQYGLTKAILEGRKTQTRRIFNLTNKEGVTYGGELTDEYKKACIQQCSRYQIGDIVAIAQKYSDIEDMPFSREDEIERGGKPSAGWDNKMFVDTMFMPHRIRITNVRVEKLQDISEEDCLAEGITDNLGLFEYTKNNALTNTFRTPIGAYASLIDKVGKKGTWESNPWVFVYEFKLVD